MHAGLCASLYRFGRTGMSRAERNHGNVGREFVDLNAETSRRYDTRDDADHPPGKGHRRRRDCHGQQEWDEHPGAIRVRLP